VEGAGIPSTYTKLEKNTLHILTKFYAHHFFFFNISYQAKISTWYTYALRK